MRTRDKVLSIETLWAPHAALLPGKDERQGLYDKSQGKRSGSLEGAREGIPPVNQRRAR